MDRKLIHICEVCGKTEMLTPAEAFNDGWDYPPRMGGFGIAFMNEHVQFDCGLYDNET